MTRWKRNGVLVVKYMFDHPPRHVHVFQDGKRLLKFDIENWKVIEGELTAATKKALQSLKKEGAFNE